MGEILFVGKKSRKSHKKEKKIPKDTQKRDPKAVMCACLNNDKESLSLELNAIFDERTSGKIDNSKVDIDTSTRFSWDSDSKSWSQVASPKSLNADRHGGIQVGPTITRRFMFTTEVMRDLFKTK